VPISDFLARAKAGASFAGDDDDAVEVMEQDPDVLAPDPTPLRASGGRKAKAAAPAATLKARKAIKDNLIVMMGLPAGMVAFRDPVCGGAIGGQAEAIADALVPIISRNPAMLRWFTEGQGVMDWITLMTAVWPVVKTIHSHHFGAGREGQDDDGPDDYSQYPAPRMAA
jgi:hypothetical protein